MGPEGGNEGEEYRGVGERATRDGQNLLYGHRKTVDKVALVDPKRRRATD